MTILQSFKNTMSNRDWWKGVFGNILSTMIGICLTIGVGALYQYHKDKQQAREMMFHVLQSTENNMDGPEMADSVYKLQVEATNYFVRLYYDNDRDLTKILGKEPEDTLNKYASNLFASCNLGFIRSSTENYFFNTQMMHQFGNPGLYTDFAIFIQADKKAYDEINKLHERSLDFYRSYRTKQISEYASPLQVLNELIEDGELPGLAIELNLYNGKATAKNYKRWVKLLLREMGATEEEYEEYKKSQDMSSIEEEVDKEIAMEDSIEKAKKEAAKKSKGKKKATK